MNNNDILRRLRYTFDISDNKMIELFAEGGKEVTRAEISDWMKKEDDPEFQKLNDLELATFLNGFINDRRGKKEGEQPKPEKSLNNNIILRKLKIALNLKDEDILDILEQIKFRLSKSELSAFFRKPDHQHYRPLKDQILRNFLLGLQQKYRQESGK
ncbi:DUF1456 family protein [Pontibacter sp. KCTC 32443]|uniref:DUF1456 family protein n=1 Tax=Pontibacter TaxID=323449 RepID=UPI00164DFA2F|nr:MULTISPECIES: DUF1456 family protein [Pontibacter]MBC5775201.1 DUF1456 family protein [Pontibacter sp. KCTC 32443]